ncbi:MAG: gliding motility-associated C-terminal domain-containing protein [Bacteroidia bacterium]|nr:gliding motility-associated C-terminal domain-containing protein [Bacteroidia bacterium]
MKRKIAILLLTFYLQGYSQQPIFVTIAGGDLYKLNLSNCSSKFIGSTGQGFGDIAFTPNGKLWGIVGGELYHIDTTNANATSIGNTGVGAVSLVGLNDTTLLAEYGDKLYGINTIHATSYYIDTIGYQAAGDLTWYDNDLYMTTGGQLIKMVLNSTYTAILSVDSINSLSNQIPTCEGAATASFVCGYNSIIGFNADNVYKICQIDGTFQMLCPSIVMGGIPGGASIRLPVQIPQPTTCLLKQMVSITGDTSICSGQSTSLTASVGQLYKWNTGETSQMISVTPNTSTSYSVSITKNGCTSKTSKTVTVKPNPVLNITGGGTIIEGQSVQLIASGMGTFLWTPDVGLSCTTCPNPFASPVISTNYCVILTDSNNCSNKVCTEVDIKCGDIFVPSAFSPNGDEQNDILFVRGKCIQSFSFVVFNRWGEKVFETNNLSIGWDGKFNGQVCNTEVFVYYLKGNTLDGNNFATKGNVSLVR